MTEVPGPYLTLCVDVRERGADRDKVIDLRWAALLDEARSAGADEESINAAGEVIAEHARDGTIESLLVVATDGQVVLQRPIGGEVMFAHYGAVPMVRPALAMMKEPVSCVVAVIDRQRAEIRIPVIGEGREEVETVKGQTNLPLRKVHPGGWSQQRFQARVDKGWLENARTMAPAIVEAADSAEAALIILAGDVRLRSIVRDEVEGLTPRKVIMAEGGGLAAGADNDPLDARVDELIEEERHEVMGLLGERLGTGMAQEHPIAVNEISACVHAAQKAQIEILLVDPMAQSEQTVWASSDGMVIGVSADEVEALGGHDPIEVSAIDALIHSAVASGSDVVPVTDAVSLPDGVAALLRFSDESTAQAMSDATTG
jgi:hypothetical protein